VCGGTSTIRQYLKEALIDQMHIVMAPAILGTGEHLLNGIDLLKLGYKCIQATPSARAMHIVIVKDK
jgi:dihydrofolate reductase